MSSEIILRWTRVLCPNGKGTLPALRPLHLSPRSKRAQHAPSRPHLRFALMGADIRGCGYLFAGDDFNYPVVWDDVPCRVCLQGAQLVRDVHALRLQRLMRLLGWGQRPGGVPAEDNWVRKWECERRRTSRRVGR